MAMRLYVTSLPEQATAGQEFQAEFSKSGFCRGNFQLDPNGYELPLNLSLINPLI
jgi:hypothetical protein